MHRLHGDQGVGEVELVEQVPQCGDLIGLAGDLQLAEHGRRSVVQGRHQLRGPGLRISVVAGTTDSFSVHGDDPTTGNHSCGCPHPRSQGLVD